MANPQRPQLPPGVLEAVKAGNKVEAIRLLREATNMGMAEAKALVDMLDKAKGVIGIAQAVANVANGGKPARSAAAAAKPVGIRPAKVRHARPAHQPLRRPGLSPGEEPRASSSAAGVLVLVAIGLAVAFSFVR
jgi:hypothetical protein